MATGPLEGAIPDAVPTCSHALWDGGHAAYVVGGRSATRSWAGRPRTGTSPPRRCPNARSRCSRTPSTRTSSARSRFGRDDPASTRSRSRPSGPITSTPTSAGRIGSSSATRSRGPRPAATSRSTRWRGAREPSESPRLVDPHGGQADLAARLLRTVGDPPARFEEDALRMVRAVRLAATLDFAVEPATLAAIRERARLACATSPASGSRSSCAGCWRADRPSVGLRLMAETGLLVAILPELAAQRRACRRTRSPARTCGTTRSARSMAAPSDRPRIRLAALLHDIGKPATWPTATSSATSRSARSWRDALLERLAWPAAEREQDRVALVRHHMFGYEPTWSDAAVRRFIAKVGREALDDLFVLREADHIGIGARARMPAALAELRARVASSSRRGWRSTSAGFAVDGRDLMTELGIEPGPALGRMLDGLLERVIADPALNDARRPARSRSPPTQLGEGDVIELAARGRAGAVLRPRRRAEQVYRQVAAADPSQFDRGRRARARRARARATTQAPTCWRGRRSTIDPENEAAQRLVHAASTRSCARRGETRPRDAAPPGRADVRPAGRPLAGSGDASGSRGCEHPLTQGAVAARARSDVFGATSRPVTDGPFASARTRIVRR